MEDFTDLGRVDGFVTGPAMVVLSNEERSSFYRYLPGFLGIIFGDIMSMQN